ncbi:DJ-1/PfpI family protein [Kutzneria kofuensis]|uniref:Transcriptional regulator GlxA family with amidase domain n=1 Tax=Kutzneria kofuensis TaxID=103725 RepID=A0A7W9KHJ0_9PSEU|nr:DJ-1/PfpI family protein [Kutzneria kofuensis]MBB5892691.1 transcriptional regulator GlxA family with amidase domain [Kutzneria kofuensis]
MKDIAFVLYPGFTVLDLVGPLQVLSALSAFDPEYRTVVLGEDKAPVPTDTPLGVTASHTFDEVPAPHAVFLPGGGVPTMTALADEKLLGRVRSTAEHAEIVGSVCTGSLILGAAGLLHGRRATTHWMCRDLLAKFGATPVAERWVRDGKFLTGAGVSAGIDLALHLVQELAGEDVARQVQLIIEYDPQPPLGGIEWAGVDIAARRPLVDNWLRTGLAGHPKLLAELIGS